MIRPGGKATKLKSDILGWAWDRFGSLEATGGDVGVDAICAIEPSFLVNFISFWDRADNGGKPAKYLTSD